MAEKKINRLRLWFQAAFFALSNGYIKGFLEKKIYTGQLKKVCLPGLNCYSCPGALASCPIGALQAVIGSKQYHVSLYVFGLIAAMGTLFGRLICGWMCPFGLVQDLLHKIPLFKKKKNLPGHNYLRYLKYFILLVFVILLPAVVLNVAGMGYPFFCKYICPSGTLLGGVPLVLLDSRLRGLAGLLFKWKFFILIVIVLLSVKFFRPFCKYLCPLGALYGFFNPISLYRLRIDNEACINCGKCVSVCKMGVDVLKNPNSAECIRCGECKAACPVSAISSTLQRKK